MTTTNFSNPNSLDVLTSTVNRTLVDTARYFNSHGKLQYSAQLKRSMPVAHEQFQTALDNLSEQIFIAKAFLERDYEAIKARKAALHPAEDSMMEDVVVKLEPETAPRTQETPVVATNADAIKAEPAEDEVVPKPQIDRDAKQSGLIDPVVKEDKVDNRAPAPAISGQPFTGPEELNFDTMLPNTGPNDFDLNLDFGDDSVGNDDFLAGSHLVSAAPGNEANEPSGNTAAELVSTDNLNAAVPAGGDAFDLELQKAEAFSTQANTLTGQPLDGPGGGNLEDVMAPGESSFDDLFMENDNFGGDGTGDASLLEGDGLVDINDLDDSWFT
ncbi:uncharacterized protein BP01DRAFT_30046 [Aspergillus saccharolyticus JOP 1030-1]|uniref:Uncharacterized protein n=1 Tax=Aspergillus saccharolyticus JOP 1030-1 TaxID=1450539 RepID=A0A318ZQX8_9EURO|nr:hypothetical protein BP01DRAFT_30046 [Aspergillus saccharolyticus JOP 1030-1]PYH46360.1 hypothetical protein BP01DRAFT_30046 [Aspergillus saccharolyticus JOP 1030-1]